MTYMSQNEGWTFEAWRKCPVCGGTGERKPLPDGKIRIGQQSYSQFPVSTVCETCNKPDDPLKRVGRERRVFPLKELPPELED
ncbi:MAG: hypothetical protein WBY94_18030 [Polyangiaceae bacterium]